MEDKYLELAKKFNLIKEDEDEEKCCCSNDFYKTEREEALANENENKNKDILFLLRQTRTLYDEFLDMRKLYRDECNINKHKSNQIDALYNTKWLLEKIIDKMLEQQVNIKE